jgi:hypothetical protein
LLGWLILVAEFTKYAAFSQAHARFLSGLLALAEGDANAAQQSFRASMEFYQAVDAPLLAVATAHCGLGDAATDLDDADMAAREYDSALSNVVSLRRFALMALVRQRP